MMQMGLHLSYLKPIVYLIKTFKKHLLSVDGSESVLQPVAAFLRLSLPPTLIEVASPPANTDVISQPVA